MKYLIKKRNYKTAMLIFIALTLLIHIVLGARHFKKARPSLSGHEKEIAKYEAELKKITAQKESILSQNKAKKEYIEKIDSILNRLDGNVYSETRIDMSPVLNKIQAAAQKCSINLNEMSSAQEEEIIGNIKIESRAVFISSTGDYLKIKEFLWHLEQLDVFILKHEKTKISGKNNLVNLDLKMKIPFIKNKTAINKGSSL